MDMSVCRFYQTVDDIKHAVSFCKPYFICLFMAFYYSTGGADGLAVRRWTCDHLGRGFESHRGYLRNNLGQVVHTYVPLLPNSITWYQSKDGDVLWLERCSETTWQKVMAAYRWGMTLKVTCGLTACTLRLAPGPTLGNECGITLPFTVAEILLL